MASILSRTVRRLTGGRSIGENVGGFVGRIVGGSTGAVVGQEIGGFATQELAKISNAPDTTQTVNPPPQPGMAGMSGPAQNIEIDFTGSPTMPNPLMQQAVYRPPTAPMVQNPITPIRGGVVGTAVGVGATVGAFVMDLLTGEPVKLVITRKLKRDTQELMALFGNDMGAVAEQLSNLRGKQFTEDTVLMILMKKFTNQGPYVTKAAVRKTRQTVRKLSTLRKLEAEICKPTTRARRTTRRTMATATAKA